MIVERDLEKFNLLLEGLCIAANALEPDFHPQYDCYAESLVINPDKTFEENIKDFFITSTKDLNIRKPENAHYHSDWIFEMADSNVTDAMAGFFHNNLFPTLLENQFEKLAWTLLSEIKNLVGEITTMKHGFICPPWQHNPYSQHWQNLYIQGENLKILMTFEANT